MAASQDPAQGFARDLGYLDKFLNALAQHARTVGGDRGKRLQELLAGEPERWAEVKRLLEGGPPAAAARTAETPASPRPREVPTPYPLTVGSLLADRRRGEGG